MISLKDISNDKSTKAVVLTVSKKQKEQIENGKLNLILAVAGEEETYPLSLNPYKDLVEASSNLQVTIQDTSIYKHVPDFAEGTEISKVGTGIVRATEIVRQVEDPSSEKLNNPEQQIKIDMVLEMYNAAAQRQGWQKVRSAGVDLRRRLKVAVKRYPEHHQWKLIFQAWEADEFWSGRKTGYDRIKILTMLNKSRYEEFYDAGLAIAAGDNSKPKTGAELALERMMAARAANPVKRIYRPEQETGTNE